MNYSDNLKIKKIYDGIFKVAGSVVGVNDLTYKKFGNLNDDYQDRVRNCIERNIKIQSNEDINELIEDINEKLSLEDKISNGVSKKFFDLGMKLYPEKTKKNFEKKNKENKIEEREEKQEENDKITIGKRALKLVKRALLTVGITLDTFSVLGLLVATSIEATPAIIATYATLPTITALYFGYKGIKFLNNKTKKMENIIPENYEVENYEEDEEEVEMLKEELTSTKNNNLAENPMKNQVPRFERPNSQTVESASQEKSLTTTDDNAINKTFSISNQVPRFERPNSQTVKSSTNNQGKTTTNSLVSDLLNKANKYETLLKKQDDIIKSIEAIIPKEDLPSIPQWVQAKNLKKEYLNILKDIEDALLNLNNLSKRQSVVINSEEREITTSSNNKKIIYVLGSVSNPKDTPVTYNLDKSKNYR